MNNKEQIAQYHLDVILGKMFEMVNLDYKAVWHEYKDDREWYLRNEWSREDEQNFIRWLADYLYQSSGARRAIMGYPIKNKKRCQDTASFFNMMYGWKVKDEAKG